MIVKYLLTFKFIRCKKKPFKFIRPLTLKKNISENLK